MKLQRLAGATLYATEHRSVHRATPGEPFRELGPLPVPADGFDRLRWRALTGGPMKTVLERLVGAFPAVNVWPLGDDTLLATAGNWVFSSTDGGHSWTVTLELPPSSGPMGVLPSAVCHHRGTTYLGEYPLETGVTPRIWQSTDRGRTWSVRTSLPAVRHVHGIEADPYADDIWVTTGDTDAQSRIGRLRGERLEIVGGGDQRWRAVQPAFTPSAVLWGMDSVYAQQQGIYRLDRGDIGSEETPPLELLYSLDGSVYYSETFETGGHRWVVFSTAAEVGGDRTAPNGERDETDSLRVLAASDGSDYRTWHEVSRYRRRPDPRLPTALADRLPAANAYAFLGASSELGLYVNPFNTARNAGQIRRYPPSYFRGLE